MREIQAHLTELYGLEVSPDLISKITSEVMDEVKKWQNRPLEPMYPLVFFDALRVKIRDEGSVKNKAVYLALGVRPDGAKEILGIWIEQTEGAKFWLRVMTELKNRGLSDVLIAVVDYLITGSEDKAVRCWQLFQTDGQWQAELRWTTNQDVLTMLGTNIEGVKGLSPMNSRLLKQRGAEGDAHQIEKKGDMRLLTRKK